MKQKIVIKVAVHCLDCRSKAMQIAAVFEGIISVAIEGKDLDRLVVTGNEVDSPCLIKRLRKKVGYAEIVTIEEVKPKSPEKPKPPPCPVPTCCSGCSPLCPGPTCYSGCSPPCPGPIIFPPPCPGMCTTNPLPCLVSCNKSPPTCQRTCRRQPSVSVKTSEYGPNCSIM